MMIHLLDLNIRPLPPVLLQRRLQWFGHAAQRPEGELIHDVLLPASLPNWWKRIAGHLMTWVSIIKDDRAELSGPQVVGLRRWNRDWLAISWDLAQDQRTWAAMVRDAVFAREEASSTRPGWKPIRVKVKTFIRPVLTSRFWLNIKIVFSVLL